MFTQTVSKRALFLRIIFPMMLLFFGLFFVVFSTIALPAQKVSAAADSTINFQARLLQASGAIVPDGTYNVEFKLYNLLSSSGSSQGSCSGDAACLWTETRTAGNKVTVKSGYLSVSLGSVSSFLGTIKWGQDLYLTMNIGGTGAPTWDGEMAPRIHLTSVPYAFQAGQLTSLSGANTATLQFAASIGQVTAITLPDPGATTATVCYQTAIACGFAPTTGGSGYVQLQGSTPGTAQTGNLNITGTGLVGTLGISTSATPSQALSVGGTTGNFTVDSSGNAVGVGLNFTGGNVVLGAATNGTFNLWSDGLTGTINLGNNQSNATTKTINIGSVAGNGNAVVNIGTATAGANTVKIGGTGVANGSNSASTVVLQGGASILTVNNSNISIGLGGTPTGQLYVSGGTPTLVGTSTNTTGSIWNAISVQGRYAYIGTGNGGTNSFQIFDVSNPASPTLVNSPGTNTASNVYAITVQGHYAYIGTSNLQVFDISNPHSPVLVNGTGTTTSNIARTLYVQGRYIYVGCGITGTNAFQIFDISNPANPVLVNTTGTNTSSAITGLNVQGRYAYVGTDNTSGTNALQIFDVSNLVSPSLVSSTTTSDSLGSLFVQGRYVYTINESSSPNAFQIFDVSSPASVTTVSSTTLSSAGFSIYVQGRYAYVGLGSGGTNSLLVLDVSNPASPTLVNSPGTNASNSVLSIYVQGRYAYVGTFSSGTNAFQIFDVGGIYTQQLQAGGIETGTLQTNGNATVNGDAAVQGGLVVGQSFLVNGNVGASGSVLFQNQTNSATAFQVQNAIGAQVINAGTTDTNTNLSNPSFEAAAVAPWAKKLGSETFTRTTTTPYIGNADASVAMTLTNQGIKQNVTLAAQQWTFSAYLRISSGAVATGSIAFGYARDGSTETDCVATTSPALTTTSWTRYSCTLTTLATSGTPYFYIRQNTAQTNTLLIDAVQIDSGATALPFGTGTLSLNGIITSPTTFQNQTDSTTAFQIQNAAGSTLLNIDTAGSNINLGSTGSQAVATTVHIADTTGNAIQTVSIGGNGNASNTVTSQAGATKQVITNTGLTVSTSTNSSTALQVQDSLAANVLNVGTTDTNTNLSNPSFEAATVTPWVAKLGSETFTRVATTPYIGGADASVAMTLINQGIKQNVTLAAQTWTFSAYLRISTGTIATGSIAFGYAANGATETDCTETLSPILTTTAWTRYSCTITTTATSGTPYFYIRQNVAQTGTLLIDGVQIDSGTVALPFGTGTMTINGILSSPSLGNCINLYGDNSGNISCGYGTEKVVNTIEFTGDSHSAAFGVTDQSQAWPSKIATLLHANKIDRAINGGMAIGSAVANAGWANVLQNVTRSRTAAPYLSPTNVASIMLGANDLLYISTANLTQYQDAMQTMVARYRSGAVFEDGDASVTYPTGTWTTTANTMSNGACTGGICSSGTGYHQTTSTANASVQIVLPADFPGGTIDLGFLGVTGGNGAINTIKEGGTTLATLDTRSVASASPIGMVARITGLAAGAHTIVDNLTSITGTGGGTFDYWEIEAPNPPLVLLVNNPKANAYGCNAFCPITDTSVNSINAAIQTVASGFDSSVVYVDADSAINKNTNYFYSDGAHYNDLGNAVIANAAYNAIQTSSVSTSQLALTGGLPFTWDTQTYRNANDGPNSFQVQRASGANVFNVNTSSDTAAINRIGTPTMVVPVASLTGGGLIAGTYNYSVTALDGTGTSPIQESDPTATVSATVASGTTGSVKITWNPVPGATFYRVYCLNVGQYNYTPTNSYTDTTCTNNSGANGGTAAPPAAVSSAVQLDIVGETGGANSYVTALDNSQVGMNVYRNQIGGSFNVAWDLNIPASSTGLNVFNSGCFCNVGSFQAATQTAKATFTTGTNPTGLAVEGRYAYVGNYTSNSLQIIDVSNPTSPVLMNSGDVATDTNPWDLVVQGHYAYVTEITAGELEIFDVSNPHAHGAAVGDLALANANKIYVSGRYAYVTGANPTNSFWIVDISNPARPVIVSTTTTNVNNPYAVFVSGRYAYVANYGANNFLVYDISNPASPTAMNGSGTSTGAGTTNPISIYVQGRYAYIANYATSDFRVFDVGNPAVPVQVGGANSTGGSSAPDYIVVQGNMAYIVGFGTTNFEMWDVTNPAAPVQNVSAIAGANPYAVAVSGTNAYVINEGGSTLQTYNLSGAYLQQLQTGGAEVASLQTNGNARINGDNSVLGGENIGQSLQVNGNVGASGNFLQQTQTNSTTAFQVQSATAVNELTVDTSGNKVIIGSGAVGNATGIPLVLDSRNVAGDPTQVDGAMYYNSNSKSFRCGENTVWRSCVGGLVNSSTADSNAVAATVTKTNFSGGTNNSYTTLANDCQPGVVYRITASGVYSNSAVPSTLTFALTADGTTTNLTASGGIATVSSAANAGWSLQAQIICDTAGAGGTIEAQGAAIVSANTASAGTSAVTGMMANSGTQALDTTATHSLAIAVTWGANTAGNTITMRQFIVERIGP